MNVLRFLRTTAFVVASYFFTTWSLNLACQGGERKFLAEQFQKFHEIPAKPIPEDRQPEIDFSEWGIRYAASVGCALQAVILLVWIRKDNKKREAQMFIRVAQKTRAS